MIVGWHCPYCGAFFAADESSRFCPQCGSQLGIEHSPVLANEIGRKMLLVTVEGKTRSGEFISVDVHPHEAGVMAVTGEMWGVEMANLRVIAPHVGMNDWVASA